MASKKIVFDHIFVPGGRWDISVPKTASVNMSYGNSVNSSGPYSKYRITYL